MLSAPVIFGKPVSTGTAGKPVASESYAPSAWPGSSLKLIRFPIGKEDPNDSTAVRLEDLVYNIIDLEDDRVSKIAFGAQQGWPTLDVTGKNKDNVPFRYHVLRTNSQNYMLVLNGPTLPATEEQDQMMDSLKLPAEVGVGKWTNWAQGGESATFADGKLDVWAPYPFRKTDEYPDFEDEDITGEGHEAEFGYSTYKVAVVNLLAGMEEKLDDPGIDALIHKKFDEDDEGDRVTYGEFRNYTVDKIEFRSVTFSDDTIEGRVDIAVILGKLYMFSVAVPRGMLTSEPVAKFFSSIKIH